ncbi:MAG TPA: AAA family ATPase [Actinocrinis sp.]|nr:AAA family ATPase [Actinocrinis sp.]
MRRYILTGTPGSGKTSILRSLQARGHDVVEEAATAVIAAQQARGVAEPWQDPAFIDAIVDMQRHKQRQREQEQERQRQQLEEKGSSAIEIYDRSPVCTHALSIHMGYPISAALTAELDRIQREQTYQRHVLFIDNLGFCEPTAARRITFEDSLEFERHHEESYRELGFDLIHIPAADVETRADLIERTVADLTDRDPNRPTLDVPPQHTYRENQ